jgi:hypothetical protein
MPDTRAGDICDVPGDKRQPDDLRRRGQQAVHDGKGPAFSLPHSSAITRSTGEIGSAPGKARRCQEHRGMRPERIELSTFGLQGLAASAD